ncbi:helix-turn-helix domain-containing protein [Sphingomonas sp. CV7422]|uniref:helix-turn-helix domain-containing protein n=1 Tax=Sphingomonas sp. CV7422 TaxID=3018036 RepID=UPI0022FE0751|nr:helix-turn-helix domain-containing protein [Sphingomonas sp. CV7422]
MTALTFGEASAQFCARVRGDARAARRVPHRTGAPVRRDSMEAGTFEDVFFAAPAPGEPDRWLRACRGALDAGRRLRREARAGTRTLSVRERPIAALTGAAVRVFEELCTLARLHRGRVFPSYDWLAEATALGRATVARALVLLEAAGFLVRQRRFVRAEGAGEGPRYRQTSNAYRALLPATVLAYLPRWMRPAPVPVDQLDHHQAQADAQAAMLAGLSARDRARATVDGALGKVLAALGAAIDRTCESQNRSESLIDSIHKGTSELALPANACA